MQFRIKEAREMAGYSQKDLAEIVGVAPNTFHGYESGKHDPKSALLKKIAGACGVSVDFLLGCEHAQDTAPTPSGLRIGRAYDKADPPVKRTVEVALEPYMDGSATKKAPVQYLDNKKAPPKTEDAEFAEELYPETPLRDIPLFLLPAAAGRGVFLDGDDYDVIQVGPDVPLSASFGVRISGDSMEPKYPDGHIAWVRMTPVIDEGRVGVFVLNGCGYIKKLGDRELISLNPQYAPIPLGEDDEFRTCGQVVGVMEG